MNYILGVELSGTLIKLTAIRKKGQSYDLIKLDSFTLPTEINEAAKFLSTWIDRFIPDQTSIKAVLSIPESTLYIKDLEFPQMDSDKLNEAVYWEIPAIAPIPQSDAVFDWKITSKNNGVNKVLVIVGKNSYIHDVVASFRKAQIDIVSIEPSSYSFARVANAPFDTTTLLILAEEKGTNYVILKDGIPFFATSTTGSSQTQKISQIKSGTDLTNELVTEGKKIITYWESKQDAKIHQVVVAGDLVYKFLGRSVTLNLFPPIPCYIGTYKKIGSLSTNEYKEEDLGSYLISIGACARNFQSDVMEGINLFPPEERQNAELVRAQNKVLGHFLTFVYTNIFVLVSLIALIVLMNIWWYSLEQKYESLNRSLTADSVSKTIDDITKTNLVVNNAIALSKSQGNTGERLKLFSEQMPQSLKLTSIDLLRVKNESWTIKGKGDRDSVLVYYKNLKQNAKAKTVEMNYSNFEKDVDNDFVIKISW